MYYNRGMLFWRRRRPRNIRKSKKETSLLRQVLYGVLSIIVVVLCGVGIWNVTRLPAVTIHSVTISGGETIDHSEIRTLVETELRGSYYLLVPHRFSYMYPHDKIVDSLHTIPRIRTVTVARTDRMTIDITFSEYTPDALWCLTELDFSECYFLDENGYAFTEAPPLRGGALIRYIIEGEEILMAKTVIPQSELESVQEFFTALESEFDMRVATIVRTHDGDLKYRINGGGTLLVAGSANTSNVLQNLQSIIESKEFAHLRPGNFNYIDLRFGNKVFVNEELETATSTDIGTDVNE
jgi:hypothetical protein